MEADECDVEELEEEQDEVEIVRAAAIRGGEEEREDPEEVENEGVRLAGSC